MTTKQKVRTQDFIKKATALHNGKYSYNKAVYVDKTTQLTITCSKHGDFETRPSTHLYKKGGCPTCLLETKYIAKVTVVFNGRYTYDRIGYTNKTSPITITCPDHGDFQRNANVHLVEKRGCFECLLDKKTKEYIVKAHKANNDKYTYNKTRYKEYNTVLTITCPKHGNFQRRADSHLKGRGCEKCIKDKDLEKFLKKAKEIHGDKYDYSKVTSYEKNKIVTITCPKHGDFTKKASYHIYENRGCPKCSKKNTDKGNLTTDEFIIKAIGVHGNMYNYTKTNYTNKRTNVTIICKIHGVFKQLPLNHTTGRGCPKCGTEKQASKITMTQEDYIKKAKEVHGDRYDYSKIVYKAMRYKVLIICKIHGEFKQTSGEHILGSNCPKCSFTTFSKGQIEWLTYLSKRYKKNIRTALSPDGEYRIVNKIPVDGYCEATNEVFEFHGTFYHGCPRFYSPDAYNSVCKRTMGELYNRTIEKENMIRKLGYKLTIIWEDEWHKIRESILKIQRFINGKPMKLNRADLSKDISHNNLHKVSQKKLDEKTCPRCKKVQHSRYDLKRHLKRKTPCEEKVKTVKIKIKIKTKSTT